MCLDESFQVEPRERLGQVARGQALVVILVERPVLGDASIEMVQYECRLTNLPRGQPNDSSDLLHHPSNVCHGIEECENAKSMVVDALHKLVLVDPDLCLDRKSVV